MRLPVINSIWIGRELGPIHVGCLLSFLRNGHRVILHCYERPQDTPAGVELADAARLLPESRIIRHRTGSLSLFADLLRYEILGAGLGLYVDCDVFCVRPIADADYILGLETSDKINCAVLKLPPNCPVLEELRAIKDSPIFAPPWTVRKRRGIGGWLKGKRSAKALGDLPWGTVGPLALTYYLKKHGLEHLASPIDRFYPVHWECVPLLFDPALSLKDVITPRTDAVHVYSSNLFRLPPDIGIPKGSPVWELLNSDCGDGRNHR